MLSASKPAAQYFISRVERVVVALPARPGHPRSPLRAKGPRPRTGSRRRDWPCPGRPIWRRPHPGPRGPRGQSSAADIAHPVRALLVDDQIAPPRPIGVGELAVLVEQDRQPVGSLAQLLGFEPAGDLGEILLGGFPGVVVDKAGQLAEEPPNDLDVFSPDVAAPLGGRGVTAPARGLHRSASSGARDPRRRGGAGAPPLWRSATTSTTQLPGSAPPTRRVGTCASAATNR